MFNVECLMFKEIKVMKALRYLLIAFAAMTVLSVSAQSMAQQPGTEFHSTSSMVGSGSTLPQAAQSGAYTTYETGGPVRDNTSGIRTAGPGQTGDGGPDDREDPYGNPIGDAAWPLALCALAFALFRYVRKRTRA